MKLFLEHYYIMTNDSNIDFKMNFTHNPLKKILFLNTAAIILDKCFITVVLYPLATWREHHKLILSAGSEYSLRKLTPPSHVVS